MIFVLFLLKKTNELFLWFILFVDINFYFIQLSVIILNMQLFSDFFLLLKIDFFFYVIFLITVFSPSTPSHIPSHLDPLSSDSH